MNDNSSMNTGLLVIIVILLIIGGFWFLSSREAPQQEAPGIEVNLPDMPNNNDSDGGDTDGQQ